MGGGIGGAPGTELPGKGGGGGGPEPGGGGGGTGGVPPEPIADVITAPTP